jgi:hypothetical protein
LVWPIWIRTGVASRKSPFKKTFFSASKTYAVKTAEQSCFHPQIGEFRLI